jgi:hypothetical protein
VSRPQLRRLEDEDEDFLAQLRWVLGSEGAGRFVVECPHEGDSDYETCTQCLRCRTLAKCDACCDRLADHACSQLLLCTPCHEEMAIPAELDPDSQITVRIAPDESGNLQEAR